MEAAEKALCDRISSLVRMVRSPWILMCGLSTGFFFAVVSRLYQAYDQIAPTSQSSSEPS